MISATHFIELIRVDNGTPVIKTCRCSPPQPDESPWPAESSSSSTSSSDTSSSGSSESSSESSASSRTSASSLSTQSFSSDSESSESSSSSSSSSTLSSNSSNSSSSSSDSSISSQSSQHSDSSQSSSSSSSSSLCIDPSGGFVGANTTVLADVNQPQQVAWFENVRGYAAGQYEVELLGYKQMVVHQCEATPEWSSSAAIPEHMNRAEQMPLANWTMRTYNAEGDTRWANDGNSMMRTWNGPPAFATSDFKIGQEAITIRTWVTPYDRGVLVKRPGESEDGNARTGDNDYVGVAFCVSEQSVGGVIRPRSYYLVQWKAQTQDWPGDGDGDGPSEMGFKLLRVTNSAGRTQDQMSPALWAGEDWIAGNTTIRKLAESLGTPWQYNKVYDWTISYRNNGSINIIVRRVEDGYVMWDVNVTDNTPLAPGKIGFYNNSQEGATYQCYRYLQSNFVNTVEGVACIANKSHFAISGRMNGIGVLIHKDDDVVQSYNGVAGDPVTITIPRDHILLENNIGYLVGTHNNYWNAPRSCAKTITDGLHTWILPAGTSGNRGSGNVRDAREYGFTVARLGENIPLSTLYAKRWIAADGIFNFKFVFIPSGGASAYSVSSSQAPIMTAPPITTYDWKVLTYSAVYAQAPHDISRKVIISHNDVGPIGIRCEITPTGLHSPVFRLRQLSTLRPICGQLPVVRNRDISPYDYNYIPLHPKDLSLPKQIAWTHTNSTLKSVAYRFVVRIDPFTFDVDYGDDSKYFRFNGDLWTPGNKTIGSHKNAEVQFLLPFDTSATEAIVGVYENGSSELATSFVVPITLRTYVQRSLKFNRDLIPPAIPDITAKVAAMRRSIPIMSYDPYLYMNESLTKIAWGDLVRNGDRVVCIHKDVTAFPQVIRHLRTTKGILPRRYVSA